MTLLSVAIAVFLFASMRGMLDGFNAAPEASSSTWIVTQRSTSLCLALPTTRNVALTVRGIYRSGGAAVDNRSMMLHPLPAIRAARIPVARALRET